MSSKINLPSSDHSLPEGARKRVDVASQIASAKTDRELVCPIRAASEASGSVEGNTSKSAMKETRLSRIARRNLMAQGIFPQHDLDGPSEVSLLHSPKPLPGLVTTLIEHGTHVTAADYPMAWTYQDKGGVPSTAHEIAFDRKNGFDKDFLYVSGMTVDSIARVSKKDPTRQQIFTFPKKDCVHAQPHTLRFANVKSIDYVGMLWVGLENQGQIVRLNMTEIMKKYGALGFVQMDATEGPIPPPVPLQEDDLSTVCDVHISGDSIPTPINTRPHGFCFDKDYKHIWFTGKLTNTVGRIAIHGTSDEIKKSLQHFALPTLGAVPIYLALGPDNNVWGTCLANSIVFRVTTDTNPVIDEIHISQFAAKRRPIAIQPDPRGLPFMWLSTEAGHSICRLDTQAFKKEYAYKQEQGNTPTSKCVCSSGCQFLFRANNSASWHSNIITEFPVPKVNHKMKLGGLAIANDGAIWTQSYVDAEDNPEELPDYIIKLGFNVHDPTFTHDPKHRSVVNMTGVPIEYYELPTKNTILHRIAIDPDERVWFTELGADRIGTIKFEASRTKREASEAVKQKVVNEALKSSDRAPQPALRRSTLLETQGLPPSAELRADRSGTIIFEAPRIDEKQEASESVKQNEENESFKSLKSHDRPPQPALRRTTISVAAGRSHSVWFRKTRKFISKATSVSGFFPRPSKDAIP
jgi:virginiamycin B lyase